MVEGIKKNWIWGKGLNVNINEEIVVPYNWAYFAYVGICACALSYRILTTHHPYVEKSQISFARLFLLAVLQHHFLHFSFLTLSFVKYFLFLGLNITFRVYIHNQAFLKLNEYTFQVINFFIRRYKISIMPKNPGYAPV